MSDDPGNISNAMPAGEDWLVRKVQDLERAVRELRAASNGPLVVNAGGWIQSSDFDGALPATPGTVGWALGGAGSNAIFNNLVLRGGIIGDAALANPAAFGVASQDWSGLTFTTVNLEKDALITVPSGYSRALVTATATAGATASSTAVASVYVSCSIQGSGPAFVAEQLAATYAGSVTRGYAASLTGLATGSTVAIGALGVIDANGSVVAGSCNLHVTGSAIFLR